MNDYKALIAVARGYRPVMSSSRTLIRELADALEALVKERDAAQRVVETHACAEYVELAYRRTLEAQRERDAEREKFRERLGDLRDEHGRQVASYVKRLENTTSNYLIRSQAARDAEAERDALRAQLDQVRTLAAALSGNTEYGDYVEGRESAGDEILDILNAASREVTN